MLPAARASAQSPAQAIKEAEEGVGAEKNPWRGSRISYEHGSAAIGFKKDAELTWNPIYVHTLSLQPQWYFSNAFYARARFDLEQELTNSDYTNKKNELEWSDLSLELATTGWKEETSGVRVSGGVRVALPLSKLSHAQTLKLGISPGLSLSRSFDVLSGLTVSYAGRFNGRIYDQTTAQTDGHGIVGCNDGSCDYLRNSGYRNSPWDIGHGPMVSVSPIDELSLTASLSFVRQQLFKLGTADVTLPTGNTHLDGADKDPSARYVRVFLVDATYTPFDGFWVSGGTSTMAGQLAPDSSDRSPFFNRFTMVYLGIGAEVDGLLSHF
ncbi:hypothetical protein AKJ08_2573 [Vulgatibacter incomptus]|uniref:Uncharacterized protein n=1 Tax=Vulgatibacter incomptus TaxID=1391653 RepID=A0A0K1PFH8_9BACT|nr:hypothetical protein AKJ08_2573 [Vulgatibacter incomptus]